MERSYEEAVHAMQSGVKMMMELGLSSETEPKHLRVGINAAMSDDAGLVDLLVQAILFVSLPSFVEYLLLRFVFHWKPHHAGTPVGILLGQRYLNAVRLLHNSMYYSAGMLHHQLMPD